MNSITKTRDDATLLDLCAKAEGLFARQRLYNEGATAGLDDAMAWRDIQQPAWAAVEQAMRLTPATPHGATALLRAIASHAELNAPEPSPVLAATLRRIAAALA